MTRWRYALLAGLLGLLPMLLPLTVDGSLPLISAVPAYFQTSTASVQYSLSAAGAGYRPRATCLWSVIGPLRAQAGPDRRHIFVYRDGDCLFDGGKYR